MQSNNRNIRRTQQGFTLIELLIVVAIAAVLAVLAGTAYASYTAKAQVAEPLNMVGGITQAYEAYYAENGTLPTTLSDLYGPGASMVGRYVGATSIENSAGGVGIRFQFNNADPVHGSLQSTFMGFTPYVSSSGNIIWVCGTAPAPVGLSIPGPNTTPVSTTVPDTVLPKSCKA